MTTTQTHGYRTLNRDKADALANAVRATMGTGQTQKQVFNADLARFDATFKAAGAIVTTDDGFSYIDEAKVSRATVSAYRRLMQYGYANGLV